MSIRTYLFFAAVAGASFSAARGSIIFSDNFDSYADQAAFEAVWTPIGTTAPISAQLSTAQAVSAPNSVNAPGTATSNQSRNQVTFAASPVLAPGDQLVFSFDFYDSSPTGNPQRNYVNLQTVAAPGASPVGQLISLGLNNNQLSTDSGGNYYMARVLGYSHSAADPDGGPNEAAAGTSSGAYFKLNDTGAGLRGTTAGWHNLKVVITDIDATTVNHAYYVDNTLAETVSNAGPPLQYTVIRLGSGLSNGNVAAYYDNVQLEYIAAVPEPSAILLAFAAGGGFLLRRQRR